MVIRNMSESSIFLKRGVQVARVVSTSPILPAELSLEWEAILGIEYKQEPLSVVERQTKVEKLNLDGLSNWTPWNATLAGDLVLAFHDIFALEGSELGCTSTGGA